MARWQRFARILVAALGIAFAIVVYGAIGERRQADPAQRPSRLDPRAILESAGAACQQFPQARQDYSVEAERQLTYEDGSTTFFGVTVTMRNRGGRDVVVSGREARSKANDSVREITGDVRMTTSDGLSLTAESASFDEADSMVRIPGAVTFSKGRMSGTGASMIYNQTTDVLSLGQDAHVSMADEAKTGMTEFSSDIATLSRREQYLSLIGNVRAVRGPEVLQGDQGVASLSEGAERLRSIELRGNARVAGGTVVESMSARNIDLHYAEDGETLERVVLTGDGSIAMPRAEGGAGRRFVGESLTLTFSPPAVLTSVVGRGAVRLDLPAAAGEAARTVTAQSVDGVGEAGKGLTGLTFTGNVEYAEEARGGRAARTARSSVLRLAMSGEALTSAVFWGRARFVDQGLEASAGQATYDPVAGTLALVPAESGEGPKVGDSQIQIEAQAVNITLDGPAMTATGNVRTVLLARSAAAGPGGGRGSAASAARMPGLLQQSAAVNVNAGGLEYRGGAGRAVYSGNVFLWQGETAVRADMITLDRERGDLLASGNARSNIVLDVGASVGRAAEIRYDDAARTMTFASPPPVPPAPPAPQASAAAGGTAATPAPGRGGATPAGGSQPAPPAAPPLAQLSGPQGELRAGQIQLFLARATSRADRLEARTDVTIRLDTRVATGDHLAYDAAGERYVITGRPTVPVKIVETCRTTTGRTVTFFKSSDRIIVDGNEEVRTESSRDGAPCPQAPGR